ncbi:MAG: RIP metalloprotease RseP [bacterium]
MLGWLISFFGFIFVFGLVVFIHELGHFLVARYNDVEIEAFALGMGPKIASFQGPETEYKICLIPLGGYVKLAGEEPGEDEENPRSFQNRPVKARLAVLFAGAFCNILLGFFLYVPLGMFAGEVVWPARVGYVQADMPAEGKLEIGDRILEINDKKMETFQDVQTRNSLLGGGEREFLIERAGKIKTVTLTPKKLEKRSIFEPEYLIGISPYQSPVIGGISEKSTLVQKDVSVGDTIISVANHPVKSFEHFVHLLRNQEDTVPLILARNDSRDTVYLNLPSDTQARGEFFAGLGIHPPYQQQKHSIVTAWPYAFYRTVEVIKLMFQGLWGLISGRLSVSSMAGPVGIVMVTGQVARYGFVQLLGFTAFLSINLGVINLLPVPVLDGGHILLSLPELFTGKSIPESVYEYANRLGLALLLALILLVTWVDITRIGLFEYIMGFFSG